MGSRDFLPNSNHSPVCPLHSGKYTLLDSDYYVALEEPKPQTLLLSSDRTQMSRSSEILYSCKILQLYKDSFSAFNHRRNSFIYSVTDLSSDRSIFLKLAKQIMPGFRKEGITQVAAEGHRSYVGGIDQYWDEIGRLQFEFMVKNGLDDSTVFLDIGCGSLRGGCLFINFLAEKNYLGIDKEISLIILGVANELGSDIYLAKKPEFVISKSFEFKKFSKTPKMALAQSLFTHLTLDDIGLCLINLREFVDEEFMLFATYFPSEMPVLNPLESHSHDCFYYTLNEISALAERMGFKFTNIGDWKHPRGQHIAAFRKL